MRPESGRSYPCSDSNDSNNTTSRQHGLHRPKRLAVVEVTPGDAVQSRTSPASNESSHYSHYSNSRIPPLNGVANSHSATAAETCTFKVIQLENTLSYGNQSSRRKVGWSREATAISNVHQHPARAETLGTVAALYRARSIGTLPQRLTDVPASRTQRNQAIPQVTGPGRSSMLAVRTQQSVAKKQTTTTISKGLTTNKTSMVKSKSQPSFRTMLEPWSRDKEVTRNGTKDHEDKLRNIEGIEVVEEETCDDVDDEEELSDDEDEEETATRLRIEEWLEQMEGLVFEAPPTPEIDDDSPLQTDTAIHIVYEGD